MRHALRLLIVVLALAAAAAAPASAAPAEAGAAAAGPHLPLEARIAGVDVGGLGPYAARVQLQRVLAPVYEAPIEVRVRRRALKLLPARAGQKIEYRRMVDAAFALARRGRPVHVRLMRTISSSKLTAAVSALARPFYRAPRNARVKFGVTRVALIGGRHGRALDTRKLRRQLLAELRRPAQARILRAGFVRVRPAVTISQLRRIHHTFISVDRGSRLLRLFKGLRRVRTYRVAVGAAGYATPRGLRRILSKQKNPTWHVPNRAWAGSLAGQTIPPGPANPLKARFLSLGGGYGIHGTADYGSIGRAASHGCIRMLVPDVKELYNRTPVGTPVLIR